MEKILMTIAVLILMGCAGGHKKHVDKPRIIHKELPVYPYYAAKNHIDGVVVFNYDVDAEGKVSEMRIIKSTPDHLFDDAVVKAVAKWRFERNKPAQNMQMTIKLKIREPI
ncbi:hypothetical protein TUM12370_18580 [Salmonella enterica subsp. enterica serovar Choleraesuis]|nr:hypothetical protein TUM12370_18580 [Salmonella enterica subsp. enterica serovar Choleraesuis]